MTAAPFGPPVSLVEMNTVLPPEAGRASPWQRPIWAVAALSLV
jgi:hypothetical protein